MTVVLALVATACGGSDQSDSGMFDTASDAAGDTAESVYAAGDAARDDARMVDDGASMVDEEAEWAVEEEAVDEAVEDAVEAAEEARSYSGAQALADQDHSQDTASAGGPDRESALAPESDRDRDDHARDDRAWDDHAEDGHGNADREGLFVRPAVEPEVVEPEPDRFVDNRFADYGYRQFIAADDDPLSTFALDVDTGSYTVARRWLAEGALPDPASVRVEEFINWFDYDYEVPRDGLEVSVDGGPSPFDDRNLLVRVGVNAEEIPAHERPPVALTFIVDTSGSMDRDDRLGLVKDSLATLVDELHDDDTVALVVYSDNSGVVLEPTEVRHEGRILDAIESLRPGGSTNLESGLREGYALADRAFREDGINRVIIASDGVANAGIVDPHQLAGVIRGYADDDIALVTIGYGMGNFNDTMMEQLADNGDGFYAYVDTREEAERLFEDELTSTLITAAIDAKIQVEFNPDVVDEYRLIGFENRAVHDRDFRNDSVDAGELGAGHQVTAMYEIDLHRDVDLDDRREIGEVFLRWEDPDTHRVIEIDQDIDLRDVTNRWDETSADFQLATVVTALAEVLRDNPYADDVDLDNVLVEAERVADRVDHEKVDELVEMIETARDIGGRRR